ncbi:hypothetical protein ACFVZR_39075 [Streptomyces sp. NPDC058316]|uniref:hypothetical protein n=1 Tax=Streptomyces sp. NPDC058316 TaxID=3346442 RepID=UPI0036E6FCEE
MVWWLAKNDDHVEKTVADLGLLARLASAADDTDVPERLRDLIPQPREEQDGQELLEGQDAPSERTPTAADHLADALNALGFPDGVPRRAMLAKQMAEVIRTQDQHDTADDVLRRFDPPATFTPDGGEPPDPTDGGTDTSPRA